MDSWLSHMPKGMLLKSDGFASDIYDPDREFTLRRFCAERKIEYSDTGVPVRLDTFAAYGLAFQERMVPELENRLVTSLDLVQGGFRLQFDDGEMVTARQVVLAIGITHFGYTPPEISSLPSEFLSHSFHHHDLAPFKGRSVVVIGHGASGLDLAGLLRDTGAQVQLVSREPSLRFHSGPVQGRSSLWKRIRHPQSGLGPGFRSCFFARGPAAFHYLPAPLRLRLLHTTLGPSGGWFIREKVIGKVPLWLGQTPTRAEIKHGKVYLRLRASDGAEREIVTEHVIAATGYRVDLSRLAFLSPEIRSKIRTVNSGPALSSSFESSVPGLFFAGIAAANSFGPVMRFAFGAGFAARTLTRALLGPLSYDSLSIPVIDATTLSTNEGRPFEDQTART
jgi:thioredoxin reductase